MKLRLEKAGEEYKSRKNAVKYTMEESEDKEIELYQAVVNGEEKDFLSEIQFLLDSICYTVYRASGREFYVFITDHSNKYEIYCYDSIPNKHVIFIDSELYECLKSIIKEAKIKSRNSVLEYKSFDVNHILLSSFLQVFFHEITHIVRGHTKVKRMISNKNYSKAFEIDADIFSFHQTAENLRFILELDLEDAYMLSLEGIFWNQKLFYQDKIATSHPTSLTRIIASSLHIMLNSRIDRLKDNLDDRESSEILNNILGFIVLSEKAIDNNFSESKLLIDLKDKLPEWEKIEREREEIF